LNKYERLEGSQLMKKILAMCCLLLCMNFLMAGCNSQKESGTDTSKQIDAAQQEDDSVSMVDTTNSVNVAEKEDKLIAGPLSDNIPVDALYVEGVPFEERIKEVYQVERFSESFYREQKFGGGAVGEIQSDNEIKENLKNNGDFYNALYSACMNAGENDVWYCRCGCNILEFYSLVDRFPCDAETGSLPTVGGVFGVKIISPILAGDNLSLVYDEATMVAVLKDSGGGDVEITTGSFGLGSYEPGGMPGCSFDDRYTMYGARIPDKPDGSYHLVIFDSKAPEGEGIVDLQKLFADNGFDNIPAEAFNNLLTERMYDYENDVLLPGFWVYFDGEYADLKGYIVLYEDGKLVVLEDTAENERRAGFQN